MEEEEFKIPENINPIEPIDLSIFKDHIEKSLFNILNNLPQAKKTLILEQSSIQKINFFTNIPSLQKAGIEKNLLLKGDNFISETPIIVYLIPPKRQCLSDIEKHIQNNQDREIHIIISPPITNECAKFIDHSPYSKYFNVHNLIIDLFPLDYDLLSLENQITIKDIYIDENYNSLSLLSRAILKFQNIFGKIKYKYIKGKFSLKLNEILIKDEESLPVDNTNQILGCLMIDRGVDFFTPFASQFTYEGILDEYFDISLNWLKVKPSVLEKDIKQENIKVDLSRRDKFYSTIKNFNFNKIRQFLPDRLNSHSKIIAEGKKETNLKEIQKNLNKVKAIKEERASLTNHINIADNISQQQKRPIYKHYLKYEQTLLIGDIPNLMNEFYEKELGKRAPKLPLLRIFCLHCLTQCGLRGKIYDKLKRDFLEIYGFQEIFLLNNLEKMKILRKSDSEYSYEFLNSKLNLIYEKVDIFKPNDPSYSYGGYCPLTIRLIEAMISKGWYNIRDILKRCPGGEFSFPEDESEMILPKEDKNFILLVFIGGITYGEIAAIRYLNNVSFKHKFIILTTGIVNYRTIFTSIEGDLKKEDLLSMKDFYQQSNK